MWRGMHTEQILVYLFGATSPKWMQQQAATPLPIRFFLSPRRMQPQQGVRSSGVRTARGGCGPVHALRACMYACTHACMHACGLDEMMELICECIYITICS